MHAIKILLFFLVMPLSIDCFIAREKKRMKILMVLSTFPKIHDVCMLNQITGLIDRGHDVWICAAHKGDFNHVQHDVISYGLIRKTIFQLPDNLNDYDIVMFQLGHYLRDIKKTHNYKGKVVVCLRGYDITGFLQEKPHAYRELFECCDLFLPVCDYFKAILVKEGCPRDKIIVQHSAIDCSQFKFKKRLLPRNGVLNIISAGRYVEKKGFIYSIYAIADLVKKFPRLRYKIIGDGILKKKYKSLIKQLGISQHVILDGWHTHDEYIAILNNTHILIAPSIVAENNDQEGIANVLKEAMAMGVLVIATDHAGNAELIDDKVSGFLVPERNSSYIAAVIKYIMDNPHLWQSMQQAARQKIKEEFDKENENDKLEAILYKLVHA